MVRKDLYNVFSNFKIYADTMISADTKYYVTKLLRKAGYRIFACGDSKMDFYMLQEADEGNLYIGKRLSRSLREENLEGIQLIYHKQPCILADEMLVEIENDIAVCKSDSGIHGSRLAAAHLRLGQQLGNRIAGIIPEKGTAVLVLERGGRFFGDGLYSTFGGKFYGFQPKNESLPQIQENRILIVDSVINTGKSVMDLIGKLLKKNPEMEIIVAANVIQRNAMNLFENYKVFAVRISDNSFVGKKQTKQMGGTGPDTADRLFNHLCESMS